MKNNKGFTLIEIMIVMVLGMFLLGAVVYTAFTINRNMVLAQRRVEVQEAARTMIGRIVKDYRGGEVLLASATVNSVSYTTSNNTAVLQLPSVAANGDILTGTDFIVFTIVGDELRKITQADAASIRTTGDVRVGRGVTAINFSSGGVGLSSVGDLSAVNTLDISITVSRTDANLALQETFIGSVVFHN